MPDKGSRVKYQAKKLVFHKVHNSKHEYCSGGVLSSMDRRI